MKIVLDTNVMMSGLMLPNSKPGKILAAWHNNDFELVLSNESLVEIEKVLSYPKIKKRLKWDNSELKNYITFMQFFSTMVDIKDIKVSVPRDPNDDFILATYLAARADYLVSGDKDLLSLKDKYTVITANEFADMIY